MLIYVTIQLQMTINEQKTSYCGKSHHIHDSDIFWLKIRIPDKNDLFATLMPSVEIQGRVYRYFNCSYWAKNNLWVKGIAKHPEMTAHSGANDDCMRPKSFVGGTPLPKSSFNDGLHDSDVISPLTLVRFKTYTLCHYFRRGHAKWSSSALPLPKGCVNLQSRGSKLQLQHDPNLLTDLPLNVEIEFGMLDCPHLS